MLQAVYTKTFQRDLKRIAKRGKEINKLKIVIVKLCNEESLEEKYRDHSLTGNYSGRRDCHVESDWLLIYKLEKEKNRLIFERTGSHSDIFR